MSLFGDLERRGLVLTHTEIILRLFSGKLQAAPTAMTVAATITAAALKGGLITGTHAVAGTQAYTLPTGTVMDAAITSYFKANDSFDFTIINLSAALASTITLTAAAGFTIVGQATIDSAHADSEFPSSGTFRARKTAANTFVAYRL